MVNIEYKMKEFYKLFYLFLLSAIITFYTLQFLSTSKMKDYIRPYLEVVEVNSMDVIAGSQTNGAGKTPPGWENPHNPHSSASEHRNVIWDE